MAALLLGSPTKVQAPTADPRRLDGRPVGGLVITVQLSARVSGFHVAQHGRCLGLRLRLAPLLRAPHEGQRKQPLCRRLLIPIATCSDMSYSALATDALAEFYMVPLFTPARSYFCSCLSHAVQTPFCHNFTGIWKPP